MMTTTETRPNEREAGIDTKLAELWSRANTAANAIESARFSLAFSIGIRPTYVTKTRRELRETTEELVALTEARIAADKAANPDLPGGSYRTDEMQRSLDHLAEAKAAFAAVRKEAKPLEALYDAEQWSRFFLVQNTNGHIHSSMSCSTCHFNTRFSWLPTLSGLGEKDAVEAQGPRLCTVCFPSAPVEWTLGLPKPEKDTCPGSGTHDHDSSGLRYYSPRAVCDHCHATVSVTSTGKMRAHKPKDGTP